MKTCPAFFSRGLPRNVACLALGFLLGLAFAASPALAAQTITIGGPVAGSVLGNGTPLVGAGPAAGDPNNNTVIINSNVTEFVSGADHAPGAGPASSAGNSVTINSGTVHGNVYGGYAWSDDDASTAEGNSVVIKGGTVDEAVYGGHASGGVGTATSTATGNSVTISNGTAARGVFGGYARRNSDGDASTAAGNRVTISGGTVYYGVYGGFAADYAAAANTLTATGNSVIINAGTVSGDVYGGYALGGAGTPTATATGNSVIINAGTVSGDVYGGSALGGAGTATATGNSVIISGGTVAGAVYAGDAVSEGAVGTATATHNTVTISGSPSFGQFANLWGGSTAGTGAGDAFTGNTLNLKSANVTVTSLQNFQYLNFYLPTTLGAGGKMLTVTGTADLTAGAGRSSTVNVGINGASSPLKTGDQVILIDADTLITNSGLNTTANGQGMQGVTLKYEFDIAATNKQLTASVTKVGVNEQTKALSEGFLSGLALVNSGADLVAGPGMSEAASAARRAGASGPTFGAFGALSGGQSRYNTGSHVDMASISLLSGLSFGVDLPPGRLILGAFFEWGNGAYDSYNSFSNAADVHGKGNTYHLGGGALARMDFVDTGPGHIYAEASFRAGGIHNDYYSSDLRDMNGRRASYDSFSPYYGFHLGAGYLWKITDKASLDLYAKYFWTRQEGDSVRLSTGDPVSFRHADSSRLRGGARFSYAVNEYVTPYVGAAYEHEFDARARATTNGFDIRKPDLVGGTGIGELGLSLTPAKGLPLSFDLGVQGYVGKREGITGSLQVKFEF
ncbi:MAG: autotransporter outer membrane beta-barrel domain-containing protein [Deltaproteobacteria bacterium]|jgi:outer membrane autotransporter protein|nr:autotransporter outer membrane beta-barrel domain-containing protein [Deltaproteobacteria bacterium]